MKVRNKVTPEIIATVESLEQAEALLKLGVDRIQFGEDYFGLRLKKSFSREQQAELIDLAHRYGKKADLAVNGIFHNDRIERVEEYLRFLNEKGADSITVGDPGVVQVMKGLERHPDFRYDMQVMVTNAKQINFWAKRGAKSAIVAREIPREELALIIEKAIVPVEVQVYGPTCIHQSKRPLLENYFNYVHEDEEVTRERDLFLSEPMKPNTHYSIYQDMNGTHIFASNDLNMIGQLKELLDMGAGQLKLDGLFTDAESFVSIVEIFKKEVEAVLDGSWTKEGAEEANRSLNAYHRANRSFDTGFYFKDPKEVQ
ncbi:U32 family peptidase [Atopobacter sp. AH10]|uniref:peptidase U32 family protein n=1 Tax=Atopobacter sp. AH10 TaxID=2315861 RepID=UPI000EF1B8A5|nr:peptidase U32 family protein [Atopobacter sp. AH10]RLK62733.1 U32 family peptidase [Atopobacter sp. AH10]